MKEKENKIDRRDFLRTMGAAGVAPAFAGVTTVLASNEAKASSNTPDASARTQKSKLPQVPRRKLGKTGVEVPCLSLGGGFNLVDNQIILSKSLEWGINYWDTTPAYAGGNSELGIGKFLSNKPKVRKKLFIATKATYAKTVADVENCLRAL